MWSEKDVSFMEGFFFFLWGEFPANQLQVFKGIRMFQNVIELLDILNLDVF